MLLSKSCMYGLRASLLLASSQASDYTSIRDMSEKLTISFHFLTKILQQLTTAKIVESQRGPSGGVRLAKPADEIVLLNIVFAIDGDGLLTECLLGLPGCGVEKPCPMHEMWSIEKENIVGMLESTNLYELVQDLRNGKLRITDNGTINFN